MTGLDPNAKSGPLRSRNLHNEWLAALPDDESAKCGSLRSRRKCDLRLAICFRTIFYIRLTSGHNEWFATLPFVVDSEDAPSRRAGSVLLSNVSLKNG